MSFATEFVPHSLLRPALHSLTAIAAAGDRQGRHPRGTETHSSPAAQRLPADRCVLSIRALLSLLTHRQPPRSDRRGQDAALTHRRPHGGAVTVPVRSVSAPGLASQPCAARTRAALRALEETRAGPFHNLAAVSLVKRTRPGTRAQGPECAAR